MKGKEKEKNSFFFIFGKKFQNLRKRIKKTNENLTHLILKLTFLNSKSLSVEERYSRGGLLVVMFFAFILTLLFTGMNGYLGFSIYESSFFFHLTSTIFLGIAFIFYFLVGGKYFQVFVFISCGNVNVIYFFLFVFYKNADIHENYDVVVYFGVTYLACLFAGNKFNKYFFLFSWIGLLVFLIIREQFVTTYYGGEYVTYENPFLYFLLRFLTVIAEIVIPLVSLIIPSMIILFYVAFKTKNENILFKLVSALAKLDFESTVVVEILSKNELALTEMEKLFKIIIMNLKFFRGFLPEELTNQYNSPREEGIKEVYIKKGNHHGDSKPSMNEDSSQDDNSSDVMSVNSSKMSDISNTVSTEHYRYSKHGKRKKDRSKEGFYKKMVDLQHSRNEAQSIFKEKEFTCVFVSFLPTLDDMIIKIDRFLNQERIKQIENIGFENNNEVYHICQLLKKQMMMQLSMMFNEFVKKTHAIVKENVGIIHSFSNNEMIIGFNSIRTCTTEELKACKTAYSIKELFFELRKKYSFQSKKVLSKSNLFKETTNQKSKLDQLASQTTSKFQQFFSNISINIAVTQESFEFGGIGGLGFQRFHIFGKGMKVLRILNDLDPSNDSKYRQYFENEILITGEVFDAAKFKFPSRIVDVLELENLKKYQIYRIEQSKMDLESNEWMYELSAEFTSTHKNEAPYESIIRSVLETELSIDQLAQTKEKLERFKKECKDEDKNVILYMIENLENNIPYSRFV